MLLCLLLLNTATPFLIERASGSWLLAVILMLVLIAAAITVASNRRHFVIALVLGIPALLSQVGVLSTNILWLEPVRYITTALFLFWVCGLLLRNVIFHIQHVTLNLVVGAVNVYLMMGIGFAYIYSLIEYLQPSSFAGLEGLASIPDPGLYFIYFSYITMSTLGYGDISPVTPYGMTASYAEAILGQLYLAILVARLVAVYIDKRKTDN